MVANVSKSLCLLDINGNCSKCGMTLVSKLARFAHLVFESPVAPIRSEATAPEVSANGRQHLRSISILADREAWPHLPSRSQLPAWGKRDSEATLAINVSRYVRRDVHQSCRRVGCIDTVDVIHQCVFDRNPWHKASVDTGSISQRETTSLGTTLARPHVAVRAPPI